MFAFALMMNTFVARRDLLCKGGDVRLLSGTLEPHSNSASDPALLPSAGCTYRCWHPLCDRLVRLKAESTLLTRVLCSWMILTVTTTMVVVQRHPWRLHRWIAANWCVVCAHACQSELRLIRYWSFSYLLVPVAFCIGAFTNIGPNQAVLT